nr:hypothetical protein [uncultured Acetobacter sp.]
MSEEKSSKREIEELKREVQMLRRDLSSASAHAIIGSLLSIMLLKQLSGQKTLDRQIAIKQVEQMRQHLVSQVGDRVDGLPELRTALEMLQSLKQDL